MPAEVVARLREKIANGDYADNPKLLAEVERRIAKYEGQVRAQQLSGTAPSGLEALSSNEYFQQEQAPNPKTGQLEDTGEPVIPGRSALNRRALAQGMAQATPASPVAPAGTHAPPAGTVEHFMDAPFKTEEDITEDISAQAPWEQSEAANRAVDQRDIGLEARSQIPTKSRSTNPGLLRPPEYKPEGSSGFRPAALAPGFVGGYYRDQTLWHEPSPEEFREAVRPFTKSMPADWLDDDLVKESDAYKRYADARWAEAYDRAEAEGRPISRLSMQSPWAQRLGAVNDAVASALGGTDEAMGAGLGLELTGHGLEALGEEGAIDTLRAQRARVPAARTAGLLGGSVVPIGAAGMSGRLGLRAAMASGLGEGAGAQTVKGIIGGAVGAGGQRLSEEGVRLASDVARGLPVTGGDVVDSLQDVGMSSLAGGAIGAPLGLLAGGAGKYSQYLRNTQDPGDNLAMLESGGGRVKMSGGIEESPDALALRARAREAPGRPAPRELVAMESEPKLVEAFGKRRINEMREAPETAETVRRAEAGGAELRPAGDIVEPEAAQLLRGKAREAGVTPGEVVADELVQPMARAHLKQRESVLKPLAEKRAAYHEEMRSTYVPATEYAKAVYDNLQKRIMRSMPGRPIPGNRVGQAVPEADINRLKTAFNRVFIGRQVPRGDVEAALAKGWMPVSPSISKTMDIPKVPGHLRFVEPVRMNPIELEETLGMLSRRAGHKTGARPADPVDLELDLAARKVRDRFPASQNAPATLKYRMPDGTEVSGYSALNARYAEAARELGDQAERAGLPRDFGMAPQQQPLPAGEDLSGLSRADLLKAAQEGRVPADQWDQLSRGMFDTQHQPFFKRIREMDKEWQPSPFQRHSGEDLYMELIRESRARPASDQGVGKIRVLTADKTQQMDPSDVRLVKELSRDLAEQEGVALSPREATALERLAVENPTDVAGGSLFTVANLSDAQLRQLAAEGATELRAPMSTTFDEVLAKTSRRRGDELAGGEPVLLNILHADRAYSLAGENVGSQVNQMVLPPGTKLRLISESSDGNYRVFNMRAESPGVKRATRARSGSEPEAKLSPGEERTARERIRGYRGKEGKVSEDMAVRTLAGRAGRGSDLDTLESIGAVDELQGKIVTPANRAELKEGIIKFKRAADRTEKDNAFRALADEAGVTSELDTLAAVNAADELRSGSKVNVGVGMTPNGAYPRAGGSLGNRAKLALYGTANEVSKPFINQGSNLRISDRLRALLYAIRLDPQAGAMARQGILPHPRDYSAFGMASGGMAARGVTGARPQGLGEMDASLSEEQVQAILQSDENTKGPLTPEEMQMIAPLVEQWRRSKEQRP